MIATLIFSDGYQLELDLGDVISHYGGTPSDRLGNRIFQMHRDGGMWVNTPESPLAPVYFPYHTLVRAIVGPIQ